MKWSYNKLMMLGLVSCSAVLMILSIDVFAHLSSSKIDTLEEVNQLMSLQNKRLRDMQRNAKNVRFSYSSPKNKNDENVVNYCARLWDALGTQDNFEIPKPVMFAHSDIENDKLFKMVYSYAKNNFNLYVSQSGRLAPSQYTNIAGNVVDLAPSQRWFKDLPRIFAMDWQPNAYAYGFLSLRILDAKNVNERWLSHFDKSLSTHLLYLPLYPVSGYTHPVVITLFKDQCDGCVGFSMAIRSVEVDGTKSGVGESFSNFLFRTKLEKSLDIHVESLSVPTPFGSTIINGDTLLGGYGIGMFKDQFIAWRLGAQEVRTLKEKANEYNVAIKYNLSTSVLNSTAGPQCNIYFE